MTYYHGLSRLGGRHQSVLMICASIVIALIIVALLVIVLWLPELTGLRPSP